MEITARVLNTFDQRFTLDHLMLILDKARGKAKEWLRRTMELLSNYFTGRQKMSRTKLTSVNRVKAVRKC